MLEGDETRRIIIIYFETYMIFLFLQLIIIFVVVVIGGELGGNLYLGYGGRLCM